MPNLVAVRSQDMNLVRVELCLMATTSVGNKACMEIWGWYCAKLIAGGVASNVAAQHRILVQCLKDSCGQGVLRS